METVKDTRDSLYSLIEADGSIATKILSLIGSIDLGRFDKSTRDIIEETLEQTIFLKDSLAKKLKFTDILYEIAITDSLTGLKNKRYFDEVLKPELERVSNLSYLMIDIDHFGKYNNRFGHKQGDKALATVADVIQEVSESDITIRYGGEEFSVILVGYEDPHKKVYEHAEDIRQSVEKTIIMPFLGKAITDGFFSETAIIEDLEEKARTSMEHFFNDVGVNDVNYLEKLNVYFGIFDSNTDNLIKSYITSLQRITVSIGGAVRKEDESVDELINRADKEALYKAKETRNMVVIAK